MGTRAVERGEASERVAVNVARLRELRRLSLRELADRLEGVGRPILASGLSKIETGDRRVDVDDLVALAEVLEVTPHALLFTEADMSFESLPLTTAMQTEPLLQEVVAAVDAAEAAGVSRPQVIEYVEAFPLVQVRRVKRGKS